MIDDNVEYFNIISPKLGEGEKVSIVTKTDKTAKVVYDALGEISNNDVILINIETQLEGNNRQGYPILELLYYIRCSSKNLNPIIFYSFSSMARVLQKSTENLIVASPGCTYMTLPLSEEDLTRIKKVEALKTLNDVKPFFKPKVDAVVGTIRHRMANFASMALMLDIELTKKRSEDFGDILGEGWDKKYEDLYSLWNSIEYDLLTFYFGWEYNESDVKGLAKAGLAAPNKKTILVDDLASKGWEVVLKQMIYGNTNSPNLTSVDIAQSNKVFDLDATWRDLEAKIKSEKPHLILLDLRLCDEQGNLELEKLGGYQLLLKLKEHEIYRGIPVIMFTATTKAETVKALLNAGAEAVWTKPGIDEGLKSEGIVQRYTQLVHLTERIFKGIDTRGFEALETNVPSNETRTFEEIRNELLKRLSYVKYRAALGDFKNQKHYFNGFTDIFIDTNILMSGSTKMITPLDGSPPFEYHLEFAKLIVGIYQLVQICGETKHTFTVSGISKDVVVPKIIVINWVLDELLKHTKKVKDDVESKAWKRALIGYEIVRGFFDDKKSIRTEFVEVKDNEPLTDIQFVPNNHHADDALLEVIMEILTEKNFKLIDVATGDAVEINYRTINPKVLLICNENETALDKLPRRLKNAMRGHSKPNHNLEILKIHPFLNEIDKIKL